MSTSREPMDRSKKDFVHALSAASLAMEDLSRTAKEVKGFEKLAESADEKAAELESLMLDLMSDESFTETSSKPKKKKLPKL
jgi:hypothetical protein